MTKAKQHSVATSKVFYSWTQVLAGSGGHFIDQLSCGQTQEMSIITCYAQYAHFTQ